MTAPALPSLAESVLLVLVDHWRAIRKRREPPRYKVFEHSDWLDAKRNGVRWSPGELFNNSRALTAAEGKRFLRSLHVLADRGFVVLVTSEGGKLWSVKLTAAGEAAAEQLLDRATEPTAATGDLAGGGSGAETSEAATGKKPGRRKSTTGEPGAAAAGGASSPAR